MGLASVCMDGVLISNPLYSNESAAVGQSIHTYGRISGFLCFVASKVACELNYSLLHLVSGLQPTRLHCGSSCGVACAPRGDWVLWAFEV